MVVVMDGTERGEAGEFTVTVRVGDQLRAELEGKRMGIAEVVRSPIHLQVLIAWAAMVREGNYSGKFAQFREDCCDTYDHEDDAGPDGGDDVDPTTPAASTDSA